MLAVLKRCQDNTGDPAAALWNSGGEQNRSARCAASDVGIVYAKRGRMAMAITVDGMPPHGYTPDNPGCLLIADLAKMLVEGL